MILAFHDNPLEPKITKCEDPLYTNDWTLVPLKTPPIFMSLINRPCSHLNGLISFLEMQLKKIYDHIQFQMSNLNIIILHAKHANLLNLAILKLQKQPCFCSCVLLK